MEIEPWRNKIDFDCDDMARDEDLRRRFINETTARGTNSAPGAAVELWRRLALSLLPIIGENGFNSLYARNLDLARETFPWLPKGDVSRPIDIQFADLKISLEGEDPLEADKASRALLEALINLLASLIGEPVTMTILSSAWAGNVSDRETTGKELQDE